MLSGSMNALLHSVRHLSNAEDSDCADARILAPFFFVYLTSSHGRHTNNCYSGTKAYVLRTEHVKEARPFTKFALGPVS